MKRWLCIAIALLLVSGCAEQPKELGTLQGQVKIGPLQPVQREGQSTPTPAPEVYAAYKIVVFAAYGEMEIARADIDSSGRYAITLPAGTYVVDINHAGMDSTADLPATVGIVSGQVTWLDVDIDTGIR